MSRLVLAFLAASFAAAAGLVPALAATAAAPTPDMAFKGARIGMTLDQWRSAPYPGTGGDHPASVCSPGGGAGFGSAARQSSTASPAVICAYVDRVGDETLPQSFALTKTYLARRPTYDFVAGRLETIEFHASIDAFDDVMAMFDETYGPATETVRDLVRDAFGGDRPRVQKIWRLPAGDIRVTDPSSRPDELSVQISGRDPARPHDNP
jgi:hypothetical protein